jgi:tRNA(Arg) A34 adenosine deaminase TadA
VNTQKDPRELVIALLTRSVCAVQVAACIEDIEGRILSWGWNSSGPNGMGMHAECHAISRANRKRLNLTTALYVAAVRRKNNRIVTARPCVGCMLLIQKYHMPVYYRDGTGTWDRL